MEVIVTTVVVILSVGTFLLGLCLIVVESSNLLSLCSISQFSNWRLFGLHRLLAEELAFP